MVSAHRSEHAPKLLTGLRWPAIEIVLLRRAAVRQKGAVGLIQNDETWLEREVESEGLVDLLHEGCWNPSKERADALNGD